VLKLRKGLVILLLLLYAPAFLHAAEGQKELLGDKSDGSRAVFIHEIPLLDESGAKILPGDQVCVPFSTQKTCGDCHSYDKIKQGWHFNAIDPNVNPGRKGQAWIYVDAASATVIPVTYRKWPGAYNPSQLGLTPWQVTKLFGRQMPGGGPGEAESDIPEETMRQSVSGKLEINCLSCHNANPAQDQSKYAEQISKENFRWAAAASSELATVTGNSSKLSEFYDYKMPSTDPNAVVLKYKDGIFSDTKKVFFDVVRKVPNERCYFCHSNMDFDSSKAEKWTKDEDVHLTGGLNCVDCHRNGLMHDINRGYEGEDKNSLNHMAKLTTCESCHLGNADSNSPQAGRLGAPKPQHIGIPPVHFEKLTCTACHSGPWPKEETISAKTSRAHGLGTKGVNKTAEVLPYIETVVYAKQQNGKIGPHKAVWPTFWAVLDNNSVSPIKIEIVKKITSQFIEVDRAVKLKNWPKLTEEKIAEILKAFSSSGDITGKASYICGGKLYTLGLGGKLQSSDNEAAKPYLWPIAHDVRPAKQSLGVRSCQDCHSTDSPFLFGKINISSPLESDKSRFFTMIELQDLHRLYMKVFAATFVFRPVLKVVAICSIAVIAGVLALYALKMLAWFMKIFSSKD
jgi:hypothetical protein